MISQCSLFLQFGKKEATLEVKFPLHSQPLAWQSTTPAGRSLSPEITQLLLARVCSQGLKTVGSDLL